MLSNYRVSKRITANSMITVTENGVEKQVVAAQMTANIDENGGANTTKTIANKEAFAANAEAVLADFAEFEKKVFLEEATE